MKTLQLKKQIYRKMYLLTALSVVLTTVLLSISFYNFFDMQMRKEVRSRTTFFTKSLNYSADNLDYIQSLNLTADESRLSIIAPDGTVLYDSYEDISELPNHLDRPEVKEAFETGYGESKRPSETLNLETFYCATKLSDNTVLRLAQTSKSSYIIFIQVLPIIGVIAIFIAVIGYLLAKALTKRIVEPINNINLKDSEYLCYDELSPFVRTISEQKELIKAQLNELDNQVTTITAITKSMSEGLILLDNKGSIISVNKSAFKIFTIPQRDMEGKNILEFTREPYIIENINKAIAGNKISEIIPLNDRFYQMFASPVLNGGDIDGVVVIFLDVTEKTGLELQRREFSANVSHELKTPLTTISGFAELINSGIAKPEDVVGFSQKIKDEATRLILLIEDIIYLSELDEQSKQSQLDRFNLLDVAHEVSESLKPVAVKKSVTIKVDGEDITIFANKRMINELLYNVVENGVKYNKDGGSVVVSIKAKQDMAVIDISDSGIGIPTAHQERVFERFYRVDKSRSKKTGGTGLGLSIVKHIVAYHKGTIKLASTVDIGTTITITLPLQ